MPRTAASAAAAADAQRQNIAAAHTRNAQQCKADAACDRAYELNWKRFKKYVDKQRALGGAPRGDKYLTRENIDMYFSDVVAKKDCKKDTAHRVCFSLQWFADNEEHWDKKDKDRFYVRSDAVDTAIRCVETNHHTALQRKQNTCPHKGIANILTEAETTQVMKYILTDENHAGEGWLDLALAWTICYQTMIRNASFLDITYDCIYVKKTLQPNKDGSAGSTGEDGRALVFIMPPYVQKKTTNRKNQKTHGNKTQLVAMFRHKQLSRCSTAMTAAHFLMRLSSDLEFKRRDANDDANAGWWRKRSQTHNPPKCGT